MFDEWMILIKIIFSVLLMDINKLTPKILFPSENSESRTKMIVNTAHGGHVIRVRDIHLFDEIT